MYVPAPEMVPSSVRVAPEWVKSCPEGRAKISPDVTLTVPDADISSVEALMVLLPEGEMVK